MAFYSPGSGSEVTTHSSRGNVYTMNKFDIKDGEYTSTIYGLIKEQRFNDAITILTFIYDTNPSSRAALSLLAYCHYYMQVTIPSSEGIHIT